mgnify:CR=1 FL=1
MKAPKLRQVIQALEIRASMVRSKLARLVYMSPAIAMSLATMAMGATNSTGLNITVTPTAPPGANILSQLISYMWWIVLAAGLGIGGVMVGYKLMVEHNMEEGKKMLFWTIGGVVAMEALLYILSHV